MMPIVIPDKRSLCKYSRHLYVLIQREQGSRSSIQWIQVIRLTFAVHVFTRAPAWEPPAGEDDVVLGCCKGMTLTGRVEPGMAERAELEEARLVALGDAYEISMRKPAHWIVWAPINLKQWDWKTWGRPLIRWMETESEEKTEWKKQLSWRN